MGVSDIWMNGRITGAAEARVSLFDHGLLYGDGVFEGIRYYAGRPFRLDAHLARLERSAAAIELELPYSREAFGAAGCGRFSYALADEDLAEGMTRLAKFFG